MRKAIEERKKFTDEKIKLMYENNRRIIAEHQTQKEEQHRY